MSKPPDIVFLFDVDNTLLDNDALKDDLRAQVEALVGPAPSARFWEIYEAVRGDVIRAANGETSVARLCALLEPGVRRISAAAAKLIRSEVKSEAAARRDRLLALGASEDIVRGLVRLYELDGVFGVAALASRHKLDELETTRAYTRLGEALGLDWAQQQVARFVPADQWERLLTAGLARDVEQLRIEFLSRCRGTDVDTGVEEWVGKHEPRITQFRELVARARSESHVSAPMLAQIAGQARILLGH